MSQINDLIKEAHEIAVAHGWWDRPNDISDQIANMHCELSEAWEEYRNGHELNEIYTKCKSNELKKVGHGGCGVCENCIANKPEGIPIELADVCIRIFDTLGSLNIKEDDCAYRMTTGKPFTLSGMLNICHKNLCYALDYFGNGSGTGDHLISVISEIQFFCRNNNIDLENAIRIKMDYNKTRPYRHGGKKA